MAECHPVGFRWVMKAKERGATIIHVDPRFSRTSALADIWVPIRAGGDIAFLGGVVRHIIENNLFFRDYVVHYTNASCILREDFRVRVRWPTSGCRCAPAATSHFSADSLGI